MCTFSDKNELLQARKQIKQKEKCSTCSAHHNDTDFWNKHQQKLAGKNILFINIKLTAFLMKSCCYMYNQWYLQSPFLEEFPALLEVQKSLVVEKDVVEEEMSSFPGHLVQE